MDSRKVDEKIDDTLNALADRSQRLDYVSMLGHCSKYAHHQSYHLGSASISVKDDLEVQMLARSFIDIHCALLGKRYQGALIAPSGSSSNLRALELARDRSGRKKVICTNLTHSSIFQACEYLDLEPIILEAKPDLGYQIDEEELARIVVRERDKVACVVSTHGTTQLGNIEDLTLSQSVQDLRSNGALLHIDAAYGGELSLFSSYLGAFPDADLMTIDPYKFIGKPGCSLLLGKAGLFAKSGPAVPYYESSDYTRSTTLSIEPILSWFYTLQENGAESIRGLADRTIGSARYVADMLRANRIRLISEPRLGVVAVSLQDNAEVCRIHEGLLQKGISVGKVAIRGKERLTAGLRLVITPRIPERHKYNLERLAGTLVCEIERHATYGDSTVDSILRPAREQDSTQIHRIQEYYLDKFQKKDTAEGFFVNRLPISEICSLIDKGGLYVYSGNKGVLGYFAAYFPGHVINPDDVVIDPRFHTVLSGRYALLEQIAIVHGHKLDIAKRLEDRFFTEARDRGFGWAVCEIALEPENKRSIDFHNRLDWKLIGKKRKDPKTGVIWGIFTKQL